MKISWKNEKRTVADLIPAEYNPRAMTEKEKRDLKASVEEFDTVTPVVINIGAKRANTIIGGHQRVMIYADLGIKEIDVRVPSRALSIQEEKRLNLRLNKNTGHFDSDKLKEMGLEMLLDIGWNDTELSGMWDDVQVTEDDFDEEKEVAKAKKKIICKEGEVWKLGDHRLMIGDSRKLSDVKKLMGENRADMIYCDPPYNIGLDYSKGIGTSGKYEGSYSGKKDSKGDAEYQEFIAATLKNAIEVSKPAFHAFYWCDERYIWVMQELFRENKIENKRVCMWVKNNASPTPQVAFNKVYEPCVYGTRGKAPLNPHFKSFTEILNREIGSGNQVHEDIFDMINIWLDRRDNAQDYAHPTQKPVSLAEKPIKRCTGAGGGIVDLFGGSGSTMIACQQLKRRAFLMEQDPVFGTVIMNRYEAFTSDKVIKL